MGGKEKLKKAEARAERWRYAFRRFEMLYDTKNASPIVEEQMWAEDEIDKLRARMGKRKR